MERHILEQYSDLLARVKYLRKSIENLEMKIKSMNREGYYVTDSVTMGKRGKKPLGTAVIRGFPYPEYDKLNEILEKRKINLAKEEQELLGRASEVEEFVSGINDVEIRNILSLYYIEDLNWVQVAHRMNGLYGKRKRYTDSSCRRKHDRFLEKILKTTVLTDAVFYNN